ncbi:hypothetical protein [Lignipirellula cremea]|uniref:Uncharacterized protein n=1 Tax=Lignipirellula cremea TaxID=2528010 RepID=A0A518E0U3_9BACT|nr:hypothetical protein [Lignipirellula cremea]QDU97710.1 hypothetical protein Pla8534_55630 [Lignipirellula cremea]
MEFTRNHYFMAGVVLLLLGAQLRLVEGFVLNEKANDFVVQKLSKKTPQQTIALPVFMATTGRAPSQTFRPPRWIGWALISVGGVLVVHALAMRKPGG